MTQEPLFIEDIYEAIRVAALALGGYKQAGSLLWPEKPADQAGQLLANCLNRLRPEKLDPEQVIYLANAARERGCHVIATQFCRDAHYADPQPVAPADERSALQQAFVAAIAESRRIVHRLEALEATSCH